MHIQAQISGYLVGSIWWPAGAECFKHLTYDCDDQQSRTEGKMTLRDHVLRATQDGDFQGCAIAQGELTLTVFKGNGHKWARTSKSFPLERFPSIADCLHGDPDWFPEYGEGEE